MCSDSCAHPLALGAHRVANDVGTIGGPHGRQQWRLPVDLQNPWSLSTLDLHLIGRQRRACKGQIMQSSWISAVWNRVSSWFRPLPAQKE